MINRDDCGKNAAAQNAVAAQSANQTAMLF